MQRRSDPYANCLTIVMGMFIAALSLLMFLVGGGFMVNPFN